MDWVRKLFLLRYLKMFLILPPFIDLKKIVLPACKFSGNKMKIRHYPFILLPPRLLEHKVFFAKKSHLNAWTKVCHILWAKSHRQPHPPIRQIARNKSGTFQHNSPRQSLDHVALLSGTIFGAMSNLQLLLTTSNRPIPLDWCQTWYHHPQKTEDLRLILMLLSIWFLANFCWHIKMIHRVGT